MKKLFISILTILLISSCSVDEGLNIDKKSPTTVPAEGLFTNGTRNFFDHMNSCNVNNNVLRLYAQYWSQTTYPDESQYNQVTRNIPDNTFRNLYRNSLQDLEEAKRVLESETNPDNLTAKLAVIEMLQVYIYSVLVDYFGNIPYSESLNPDITFPKYDDAQTIYMDLFTRLNSAINGLSGTAFSADADPVYGGDASMWKKAANSLKLRMALRLADVDMATARTHATAAASNLISSNAENFSIAYLTAAPNTNPVWVSLVQSGRNDFVGSDTMIDLMKPLNDPRLSSFFTTIGGEYIGGIYGSANSPTSFSQLSDIMKQPDLPGTLISYSEVEFLLAEAAARGISVGGTAEEHYNNGIEASIMEWGGSAADASAYLANPDVAYSTAAGDWKQKIATQKWIAMFNNGMEGWTTYRILDYPMLKVLAADNKVPTRFIYPIDEATLNGDNVNAAASAIGGDTKNTKIFWDVN